MDNILHNIGDTLIINIKSLMSGIVLLNNFIEDIEGETVNRCLEKTFRISDDDETFFTEWKPLTVENLSAISHTVEHSMLIVVKYTRVGTDTTGDIIFHSIDFSGELTEKIFTAPTLTNSIFSGLIDSDEFKSYEGNIFKKLYFRGILPKYIIRADNRDYIEDKDFVDLFKSVARFFTLFIKLFKRWENINEDFNLLREQVRQYGIYFNEATVTIGELQYLAQNIYSQAQQRGTKMIFTYKGDLLPNGTEAQVDGEFIRLLGNTIHDELLYDEIPIWKTGWVLHQSSPMYKGTLNSESLNKTACKNKVFISPDKFTMSSGGNGTYEIITDAEDNSVMRLQGSDTSAVGFGLGGDEVLGDVKYNVDSAIDYEICFRFKFNNGVGIDKEFLFGVDGFDKNGIKRDNAFVTVDGSSISNEFWKSGFEIWVDDVWYYARGIIHAYNSKSVYDTHTNLGIGTDLKFNNALIRYIVPKIQVVDATSDFDVYIAEYYVRPLVRGNNIIPLKTGVEISRSMCFIQSNAMSYTYAKNNNANISGKELTDIIEKYLYPMDTTNLFQIINNF